VDSLPYSKIAPVQVAHGEAVSVVGTSELFSTREREILKLLGQGKTSKEIAVLLTLRITTIASHRRSICHKLGVRSTAELIHYAVARLAAGERPPHWDKPAARGRQRRH